MNQIYFQTDNEKMNQVFRIALGDLYGNIRLFRDGLLEEEKPVILAGMEYDTPWTRDAAINVWNGAGLLFPEAAKNTLLSVLVPEPEGIRIGGQYWDAIIWVAGAWQYYLFTGDKDFLSLAYKAVKRSLSWFEEREYQEKLQLFSGAACYGDGISAYGDEFSETNQGDSGITHWWECNKDRLETKNRNRGGIGLPMYTLSVNCLYYQAYVTAGKMAEELGEARDCHWMEMEGQLKKSIDQNFWNEENGSYLYYLSPLRDDWACSAQEALGLAFVILFDIADERKKKRILKTCEITPNGIACVWPSFSRYDTIDGTGFGRHSGTVWPHAQGFWADAAKYAGSSSACWREIAALTANAWRDQQFGEIYHPVTGELYGGLQEQGGTISLWHSCNRQTWSATAYLRMVFMDICGMRFTAGGIEFSPDLGEELKSVKLKGLSYRDCMISLEINGKGTNIREFSINGRTRKQPFLSAKERGDINIKIQLG